MGKVGVSPGRGLSLSYSVALSPPFPFFLSLSFSFPFFLSLSPSPSFPYSHTGPKHKTQIVRLHLAGTPVSREMESDMVGGIGYREGGEGIEGGRNRGREGWEEGMGEGGCGCFGRLLSDAELP